jgi:hypothetical protein
VSGFVYFVQATNGGPIKIGYTASDPANRLKSIQTGSPFPLRVIASRAGTRFDEAELHDALAKQRLSGEWFDEADLMRAALERIAAPKRPDGTYNLGREACEQIARSALGHLEDSSDA